MEKVVLNLNWLIAEYEVVDAIENDFVLLDKPVLVPTLYNPFKVDVTIVIFCLKGTAEGSINLKPFKAEAPCQVVVLADQIVEQKYVSDDFSALFVIMSKRFTDNLLPSAQERLPLFLFTQNNPCLPLGREALEGAVLYFEM
ncbi:MAG: hypothetical protein LBB84_04205, partial [Tannerellaceae bacterium]|nr:hypothetical protein [Tannerellaceae bacterium]